MKKRFKTENVIFCLYFIILVWIILFKAAFSIEDIKALISDRSLNLIPFHYENDVGLRFHLKEVILNLIIFIPFGFYLEMLLASLRKSLIYSISLILCLELTQLIFCLGAFDITDIITNALGSVAGACLYMLFSTVFKNRSRLNRVFNVLAIIAISLFFLMALLLFFANR